LPIAASTFHRFGKEIIGQARGYSPSVCNDPDKVILSLIDKLCNSDTSFAKDWLTFITVFMPNFRLMTDFVSKAELDSYMSRQGIKRGEAPRALAGHRVASMEELSISNWMFLHGYYYEYERPYPYNLADKDHRQYLPDFYFPDADIYYEHFGVDNNGRPAPFLGQEYVELIHAKRKLHAQHKTRLIETCSGQFADGSIFTKLESMLVAAGINAIPLTSERLKAAR
jgi:DNA helicase-4